jgi:hypothetical protein
VVSLDELSALWASIAFSWWIADALRDGSATLDFSFFDVHADWAWESLGNWAVLSSWVAFASEAIATVLLGKDVNVVKWALDLDWLWAVLFVATDALLLEDWLAAFTWRADEDFISSHPDVTLGASSLHLIVNWALAWIASAVKLGTAWEFSLNELLTWAITDWGWWAVLWFTTADLVVLGAAFVIFTVDVFIDWLVLDPVNFTVDKVLSVTLLAFSAVFWATHAGECWAALPFKSVFSSSDSWVKVGKHGGLFLAWDAVFSLVTLEGDFAHVWFADALSTSTHGFTVDLDLLPRSASEWIVMVKWVASFLAAATASHWATVVDITFGISKLFSFTKSAVFSHNSHVTVFSNIGATSNTLAIGMFAASIFRHTRSENVSSWARSNDLWA